MKFRISICTKVSAEPDVVWRGFDESLFKALALPFPRLRLLRFDGSNKDDRVIIELNFILFKQTWESEIVFSEERDNGYVFMDIGRRLPFFLKEWQHRHEILLQKDGSTQICDKIIFSAPGGITGLLLYPMLYLQFLYRKPVYQKFFGKITE